MSLRHVSILKAPSEAFLLPVDATRRRPDHGPVTTRGDEGTSDTGFAGTTATPTAPSPRAESPLEARDDHDRLDTILRQFEAFGRIAHIGGVRGEGPPDKRTGSARIH